MTEVIGTIITDCNDDNARGRQELRFASLFGVRPSFLGVGGPAPGLEAAGNLIDQLDALTNLPAGQAGKSAVILVNVAPRGEEVKKKWNNGTPFCYFRTGNILVLSTFEGSCLSLAHKMGLVSEVQLMDIPSVTARAVADGRLTPEHAERINNTQFRSLEFLPLAAYWLHTGKAVLAATEKLAFKHDSSGQVWWIDNFGNAKTTLTTKDVAFEEGKTMALADGQTAACHRRLADVPKDASALTIGSSGYGDNRFLEVVVQWQDHGHHGSDSAAKRHDLHAGSPVLKSL